MRKSGHMAVWFANSCNSLRNFFSLKPKCKLCGTENLQIHNASGYFCNEKEFEEFVSMNAW
jgi:hypothetical protein